MQNPRVRLVRRKCLPPSKETDIDRTRTDDRDGSSLHLALLLHVRDALPHVLRVDSGAVVVEPARRACIYQPAWVIRRIGKLRLVEVRACLRGPIRPQGERWWIGHRPVDALADEGGEVVEAPPARSLLRDFPLRECREVDWIEPALEVAQAKFLIRRRATAGRNLNPDRMRIIIDRYADGCRGCPVDRAPLPGNFLAH